MSCVLVRGVLVCERRRRLGDDSRRFTDLERVLRLIDRDRERRRRLGDDERRFRGFVGSLRRADSEYVGSS